MEQPALPLGLGEWFERKPRLSQLKTTPLKRVIFSLGKGTSTVGGSGYIAESRTGRRLKEVRKFHKSRPTGI